PLPRPADRGRPEAEAEIVRHSALSRSALRRRRAMTTPDGGELNALLTAHDLSFPKMKTPGFLSRGFVEGEGASRLIRPSSGAALIQRCQLSQFQEGQACPAPEREAECQTGCLTARSS